jgi:hypothetical protein
MTAAGATADLDALRDRVRASQHARSVPLLVIGTLLVNYGATGFAPHPVQWRYGAPLAFVLVWLLGKLNETQRGVGPGRADYLMAAGAVFTVTNLMLLDTDLLAGTNYHRLTGIWVATVGVALAVLSRATRDRVVLAAGLAVVLVGAMHATIGHADFEVINVGYGAIGHNWSLELIALVGGVLALTGLLLYRRERSLA